MKWGKWKNRTESRELLPAEKSGAGKELSADRKQDVNIDRLKEAKDAYRKIKAEARERVLRSRDIVRDNREKQKQIRKSFDTAYRKEDRVMDHALSQIREDNTPARNIHAAEEIRRSLGKEVQHMSAAEFADMMKGDKPLSL